MSAELRIGDTERDAAVTALSEHFVAGRLSKEEYDERTATAWTARTSGALTPLFVDLPAPHAPRTGGSAWAAASPGSASPSNRASRSLRSWSAIARIIGIALLVALAIAGPIPWFVAAIVVWVWWQRAHSTGCRAGLRSERRGDAQLTVSGR